VFLAIAEPPNPKKLFDGMREPGVEKVA